MGTLADVNGDGYADLLVPDRTYNSNQGRAYVFESSGAAGITAASPAGVDTILGGTNSCYFGLQFGLADVNNDGLDDAIVGDRAACAGEYYYMFHAGAGGIASQDLMFGGSASGDSTSAGTTLSTVSGGSDPRVAR